MERATANSQPLPCVNNLTIDREWLELSDRIKQIEAAAKRTLVRAEDGERWSLSITYAEPNSKRKSDAQPPLLARKRHRQREAAP